MFLMEHLPVGFSLTKGPGSLGWVIVMIEGMSGWTREYIRVIDPPDRNGITNHA